MAIDHRNGHEKNARATHLTIQRADPRARKIAILIIGIVSLLGISLISAVQTFEPEISSWLEANDDWLAGHPQAVFWTFLGLISPILATTLYLFNYARLAAKAQRLPPPGYAVIRDTRIIEGISAVRRARIVQVLTASIALLAGAVPVAMWYIFRALA